MHQGPDCSHFCINFSISKRIWSLKFPQDVKSYNDPFKLNIIYAAWKQVTFYYEGFTYAECKFEMLEPLLTVPYPSATPNGTIKDRTHSWWEARLLFITKGRSTGEQAHRLHGSSQLCLCLPRPRDFVLAAGQTSELWSCWPQFAECVWLGVESVAWPRGLGWGRLTRTHLTSLLPALYWLWFC